MELVLLGRAHKYGDNIDTDVIIPARYCSSFAMPDLAPHCLEDLDAGFAKRVRTGDILVAGKNFGCGSSRENAPIAIKGVGVSVVIAASFARIFFRNSINIGLPIIESPEASMGISNNDEIRVDLKTGSIHNLTTGKVFQSASFSNIVQEIVSAGGMVPFVKRRLASQNTK